MAKIFYHGTDSQSAQSILANGIDQSKSAGGYFGTGFYLAEDASLAQSNYADFSGDANEDGGAGIVLACTISDQARILDLANEHDWEFWKSSGLDKRVHESDFWRTATNAGIDGLLDNSFGGVVIYNINCVTEIAVCDSLALKKPTMRP